VRSPTPLGYLEPWSAGRRAEGRSAPRRSSRPLRVNCCGEFHWSRSPTSWPRPTSSFPPPPDVAGALFHGYRLHELPAVSARLPVASYESSFQAQGLRVQTAKRDSGGVRPRLGDVRRRRGWKLDGRRAHTAERTLDTLGTHGGFWCCVRRATFCSFSSLIIEREIVEMRIVPLLLADLSLVHPHARKCAHVRNPRHRERAIPDPRPPSARSPQVGARAHASRNKRHA
jgi:hypothetical protein